MKKILSISLIFALVFFTFQSCEKKTETPLVDQKGQIEFSFTSGTMKNSMLQGLESIVISIEDTQGNVVVNSEEIEIYSMNGSYISKPISLLVGDYKLTQFIVLNADNEIVYASPIEGSSKAYLVQKPLPISFSTVKDQVTKVNPEVLSTTNCVPQDFGYATFDFEIAETFDFLVGAFVYNEIKDNFELTTANIEIYSGETLVYSGQLQANLAVSPDNYDPLGITNQITLPRIYDSFTIRITRTGYLAYNKTFTQDELSLYFREEDNGPLVVILKSGIPGLVAYYPFNGNANDESGNGNDGTNYGAIPGLDKNGNENSAFSFDGIQSYIVLNQPFDLPEASFSMWVNARTFPVWNYPSSLSFSTFFVSDNPDLSYSSYSLNASYKNGANKLFVKVGYMYGDCEFEEPMTEYTWNHVVLTKDLNNVKVYFNGVLLSEKPMDYDVSPEGNANAIIGCSRNQSRFFDGLVDEVKIFNRVLNDEEVEILYNNY